MKQLSDFIKESLVNEANLTRYINNTKKLIKNMYDDDGDLVSVASCFNWLDALDWDKRDKHGYDEDVMNINDDISDDDMHYYGPVMSAMAKIGKAETIKIIKSIVDDESELNEYDIK